MCKGVAGLVICRWRYIVYDILASNICIIEMGDIKTEIFFIFYFFEMRIQHREIVFCYEGKKTHFAYIINEQSPQRVGE